MTEAETAVLRYLAERWDTYDGGGFYPFKPIMAATRLDRKKVRRACRALKRKGLAEFSNGLWSDDGEPAGAGYSATARGYEAYCGAFGPIVAEAVR